MPIYVKQAQLKICLGCAELHTKTLEGHKHNMGLEVHLVRQLVLGVPNLENMRKKT